MLKALGAEVVGAARGARKLDFIRDRGADEVVDYSVPGWVERVDVVFDGSGGDIGCGARIGPGGLRLVGRRVRDD